MKIFFDTEFFDTGTEIRLISIGMVREDGATYYAETGAAQVLADKTDWLRENVLPHLTGAVKRRDVIAQEIVEFAGPKPEFWAYFASYDWVALCQLYGTMMSLPRHWPKFVRDIKQLREDLGGVPLPAQPGGTEHDALADARQNKRAYEFLIGLQNREAA